METRCDFPRVPAHEAGVSPRAVLAMLRGWAEKGIEVHSFMVLRGGKIAAEGYWHPYRPGEIHILNSVSKSFTATAILFAIQEGILSPDEPLVSFFPELSAKLNISEKMRRLQLRHLLAMCTGHEPSADFIFGKPDPVAAFLESEIAVEPGTKFAYNSGASFMLSAALQARTGQNLLEYLRPRLFEPLGMSEGISSDMTPDGICFGGFGMYANTLDLAKLGMLYLNRGELFGKRLLKPELIDEATRRHIPNGSSAKLPLDHPDLADDSVDSEPHDWGMGYAWQFWRCKHPGTYRADGMFGQEIFVMPKEDMVVAITAGTHNLAGLFDSVWYNLAPGVGDNTSPDGQEELDEYISKLSLPAAEGEKNAPAASVIDGATYKFDLNGTPFTAKFEFDGDILNITAAVSGKTYKVEAGYGRHIYNSLGFENTRRAYRPLFRLPIAPDFAASWAWNKDGALVVKCVLTKHAHTDLATVKLEGGKAVVSIATNLQPEPSLVLEGTRE